MNKNTLIGLLLFTAVGIGYWKYSDTEPAARYNEFMACEFGDDMNSDNLAVMISEWQELLTSDELRGAW
jgi:hypothetical protein